MKRIVLILGCSFFLAMSLWAQSEEPLSSVPAPKFKPRYAGTSVETGMMFSPGFGSAFYVTPKISFQATPRLFVNAGVGLMQYSLLPSQMKSDLASPQRTATSTYIYAEGVYLLNERWSVNGSVMKDISPGPLRQACPYRMPSEAMHFGVHYKITPHITVGARIGYSNGGGYNSMYHSPFYPY